MLLIWGWRVEMVFGRFTGPAVSLGPWSSPAHSPEGRFVRSGAALCAKEGHVRADDSPEDLEYLAVFGMPIGFVL